MVKEPIITDQNFQKSRLVALIQFYFVESLYRIINVNIKMLFQVIKLKARLIQLLIFSV